MATYIRFDREHSLEVTEDIAAVERAIETAGDVPVPLISLTRKNGTPVLVNARGIRTLAPAERGGSTGFNY